MPEAKVNAKLSYGTDDDGRTADVTLTNTGDTLAFLIEMRIVGKKSQHSLTPVFWDDNYISLPPHTTKTIHAKFPDGEKPELNLQGWNVAAQVLK
jgi:exo-1,4-beta-D-glucosaminidase